MGRGHCDWIIFDEASEITLEMVNCILRVRPAIPQPTYPLVELVGAIKPPRPHAHLIPKVPRSPRKVR